MATTSQLYVYIRSSGDINWPWHYEAELKRGQGNGQFLSLKTAWGESPDKALQGLGIDDKTSITFVRENENAKSNAVQ